MSVTDDIKARVDIVDLISESGVKLRKSGRNYTGFCPFHANKHTPAFVVWPETGTWRCFGECNEGGDVFKFVMKKDGVDFREALTRLAARAGLEVPAYRAERPEQKEAYDHLRKLLEDAVIFYAGQLRQNAEVLTYLRERRKLSDDTMERFGLGYAPNSWDTCLSHFRQRGYSEADLLNAGLVSERQADSAMTSGRGNAFDRFRNRIMIPIRDENGRMAGFGARIVDPDDIPKFLNSPETPIFVKGHLLYGLDRARKPIRTADEAVIVEGYLDVIALHQAGYENVISPMGTALTEEQLRLVKRFTRKIVLALDPDTAGQKAILRGLEAARQAMAGHAPVFDQGGVPLSDGPNLMKFAGRLDAHISVVSMPDGLDPDEIVARDKDEWERLVAQAKPIVLYDIETLIAERNTDDPKVKAEIVREVAPLIESVGDAVERDDYRQRLARRLKVDERVLIPPRGGIAARRERGRVRRSSQDATPHDGGPGPIIVPSSRKVEVHVLAWLFRNPDLLYRVDRLLQQNGLATLSGEDFEATDHQLLFGLIRQSLEQDQAEHQAFVAGALPESLKLLAQELLAQTEHQDVLEQKLLEELLRSVKRLRQVAASEKTTQYRFLQEEAEENGDSEGATFYEKEVLKLTQLKRVLDEFDRKMSLTRME